MFLLFLSVCMLLGQVTRFSVLLVSDAVVWDGGKDPVWANRPGR